MPSGGNPLRGLINGLLAAGAIAAVVVLARGAMEKQRAGDVSAGSATASRGDGAAPDPEKVRSFYDAAIRRIEAECSPTDKRCEMRVKKEEAATRGLPEEQAQQLFMGEALRRGVQGP